VKRLTLVLAAMALFLTAAALPSMADGFPTPHGTNCPIQGCIQAQ
jgi:hypothetical protein